MDFPQKFVRYTDESTPVNPHGLSFTEWIIKICPYEVILRNNYLMDCSEVDDFIEGKWSSYILGNSFSNCVSPYYFELESDAMAFKLKWS